MTRYALLEPLGHGALATVFRVRDKKTGALLAGKVLHQSHEDDEAAAARFAQEARLLEHVRHENLVAVHGLEEIDGRRVLLMELVDGPDLATLIATDAPLPAATLIELARQIALGLTEAHGSGIIHRDLKPSNVLLAGGAVPKIADFGMARASSIAGVDRNTFAVVGTPDYMPPEALDPLAVDARGDLYALGCMIFEMATGHPPYTAATPFGLLGEHRNSPIPELPAEYGAGLAELTRSLLAKSPADRPQSAAAVAGALQRVAAGDPTALVVTTPDSSRCANCNGPLIRGVGVCLGCGIPVARLEPGGCTLLVTGPGKPGDKIDSELRERLRQWLVDNPDLGLIPAKGLEKKIPRLPFTLTQNISHESGQTLVRSLERLGLTAEVVQGGPLASPAMRKKVKGMIGRGLVIAATTCGFMWQSAYVLVWALIGFVGVGIAMTVTSLQRVTKDATQTRAALPAPVRAALDRVEKAVPGIEQPRHREGLRAAVARATELAGGFEDTDDEVAEAIDAATAAAGRLDALDRKLAKLDRDVASDEARALLHERDTWSARLLSLTATLESLQARIARVRAKKGAGRDDEALSELRAHVEALEEVQAG